MYLLISNNKVKECIEQLGQAYDRAVELAKEIRADVQVSEIKGTAQHQIIFTPVVPVEPKKDIVGEFEKQLALTNSKDEHINVCYDFIHEIENLNKEEKEQIKNLKKSNLSRFVTPPFEQTENDISSAEQTLKENNSSNEVKNNSDVPPTSKEETNKNDSKKEEDSKILDEMNDELSKMTTIVDCANLITTQKYKNFEKSCSLEFLDEFKTLKKSHVDRCAINDLSFDLAGVRNKNQLDEVLKFYPRFAQEDEKIKQMIQDIESSFNPTGPVEKVKNEITLKKELSDEEFNIVFNELDKKLKAVVSYEGFGGYDECVEPLEELYTFTKEQSAAIEAIIRLTLDRLDKITQTQTDKNFEKLQNIKSKNTTLTLEAINEYIPAFDKKEEIEKKIKLALNNCRTSTALDEIKNTLKKEYPEHLEIIKIHYFNKVATLPKLKEPAYADKFK